MREKMTFAFLMADAEFHNKLSYLELQGSKKEIIVMLVIFAPQLHPKQAIMSVDEYRIFRGVFRFTSK